MSDWFHYYSILILTGNPILHRLVCIGYGACIHAYTVRATSSTLGLFQVRLPDPWTDSMGLLLLYWPYHSWISYIIAPWTNDLWLQEWRITWQGQRQSYIDEFPRVSAFIVYYYNLSHLPVLNAYYHRVGRLYNNYISKDGPDTPYITKTKISRSK